MQNVLNKTPLYINIDLQYLKYKKKIPRSLTIFTSRNIYQKKHLPRSLNIFLSPSTKNLAYYDAYSNYSLIRPHNIHHV